MNPGSSFTRTLAVAAWCLVAALADGSPSWAICVTDDSGAEICLDAAPTRIISLYGAFTEILWEIGAGEALVARTKNDTTIPEVAELPSVGTGLRPNVEYLLALRPDLVVSRSSRAARQGLTAIRNRRLRVAGFDPRSLAGVYSAIRRLGTLTERQMQAEGLVKTIEGKVSGVVRKTADVPRRLRLVYEVRSTPLTVAGVGGLVDEIIRTAGGTNAITNPKKLLMLDVEALLRLDPDVYVVQEGPMNRNPSPPAGRPHLGNLRAVREGRVLIVDEKIFSRPGPRLTEAVEQLSRFLYPELAAGGDHAMIGVSMKKRNRRILFAVATICCLAALAVPASGAQTMTRTLKGKPAVVIAAFGTSTRAQVTYDVFKRELREALPDYEIRWAFTSEVIRQIVNARWARQGIEKRLLSLQQVLANLQAEGYTRVAVQPLHIFPGEEYEEVLDTVKHFPGLRVETGETLLQRWENVHEVVKTLSPDFLPNRAGCNVVVAHGTPSTHVGSNITYLGLDRYLSRRYPNVYLGAVEGVITREDALGPARSHPAGRVRFIPLMYVAGDHIMNDIMGEDESPEGPSWKAEVEAAGKIVDVPTREVEGETYYRGLGFLPEVNEIFIRGLERTLGRL